MEESLFIEFVKAVMPKLALYISERENNTKNARTYLHKTMLRPVYSVDQKWEGSSANTIYVAADYVAMDSPLPIKKRSTMQSSNGKLPKVGMKKPMKESELNAVQLMRAQLNSLTGDKQKQKRLQILNKIVDDEYACSVGIDEKNEATFLSGLSNGVALVNGDAEEEKATGLGLRVNYGYLASNSFGVEVKDHVSKEDIDRVISKADMDGNALAYLMLAKSTYNAIRHERWAAELVADFNNQTYTAETTLGVPSASKFDAAFEDEFGISFIKVDRTVIFEANGERKSFKPWNADKLVFLTTNMVGSLVYSDLVEANNPVEGVSYQTVESYKLISRYHKNDPFAEITAGQALVLPVIEGVDAIYTIDIKNAEEVNTTAESSDGSDTKVTINGVAYNKAAFITLLNKYVATRANASDATVIANFNKLSDEDEAALLKEAESAK